MTAYSHETARGLMVENQLRPGGVFDAAILDAMNFVPREDFLPESHRSTAYAEKDVILEDGDEIGFMAAPVTFARLLQDSSIAGSGCVLDIGCAGGYSTAALSRLCGGVIGIDADAGRVAAAQERLQRLGLDNVAVHCRPLEKGYPAGGPYDAIVIEGMSESVPPALFDQLKPRGRLAALIVNGATAQAWLHHKTQQGVSRVFLFDCDAAAPAVGRKKPAFRFDL